MTYNDGVEDEPELLGSHGVHPLMTPIPGPGPNSEPTYLPALVQHPRATAPPVLSASPSQAAMPDPLSLLRALRRRWSLALHAGLLCAAVAAGAAYYLVPRAKYTARAMFHVSSTPPIFIKKPSVPESDFPAYRQTQLVLLKSRLVLNAALKQEGVAKLKVVAKQVDPVDWLEKELQVDFANGSEILRIGMSGEEAAEPMMLANAVVQAYLDQVVNVESKQRRDRYDLLKETWNRYQENLREKRKELRRLTELAGSDDKKTLANLQQLELERLGRAEQELAKVQSELRSLRVESEVLGREEALNTTSSAVTPEMIEAELSGDRSIEQLAERVAKAQRAFVQVFRLVRNGSDPAFKRASEDLKAAQSALAAQRKKLYPIIAQQLQEKTRGNIGMRAALLRERVEILSRLESTLSDDVKHLSERSRSINRTSVDLFSIQEEIANADAMSKRIGEELETLNVEFQAPPRIRLLEKAELPRTKDERRPLKMAGMVGGGAFALALVGIAFWEFRARRIDSADEVVHGLGMRIIGILPILRERDRLLGSRHARRLQQENLLIESVDAARTALLHASRTDSVRVLMVASALGGEGKTTLACHLATSLARAGRRILLIDGDLRRPSVHELFDLPQVPGLCEVLRGEAAVADVVRPALADGLWLVPAGNCSAAAIHALAYTDLRATFGQLTERYDFILIDSSPILPVADALLIGQHVDAVLFSIMRDVSRLPRVHAAYERVSALGIRMLGAIVTGEKVDHYGGYYQVSARPADRS
jgi:polysaccharide biosynthesis transport protein